MKSIILHTDEFNTYTVKDGIVLSPKEKCSSWHLLYVSPDQVNVVKELGYVPLDEFMIKKGILSIHTFKPNRWSRVKKYLKNFLKFRKYSLEYFTNC